MATKKSRMVEPYDTPYPYDPSKDPLAKLPEPMRSCLALIRDCEAENIIDNTCETCAFSSPIWGRLHRKTHVWCAIDTYYLGVGERITEKDAVEDCWRESIPPLNRKE